MTLSVANYSLGVGIVSAILVMSAVVARWSRVRRWCRWGTRHRQRPHLAQRLTACLEHLESTPSELSLGCRVLTFLTEALQAESSSLLVWDETQHGFVLQEHQGAAPGSFSVGDTTAFLRWLAQQRRPITRQALIHDPALGEVKTLGLQYCVQFHTEICVPCFRGEQLIAVMNFGPCPAGADTGALTMEGLAILSRLAALAIHNSQLQGSVHQHVLQLTQVEGLRRQVLANVSHEFRTPLSSIIGLSEHLLEQGIALEPGETQRYLGMIREAGQRLLSTVTALLDLSKLESQRAAMDIRRINLPRLASEVCAALKPSTATQISVQLSETMPPIYGDVQWVRCVFAHLLDNAVKYTPRGSVWIEAERAGDMLKVGIHDTGIGIAKDRQEAIFNSFVQGEDGPTRGYEGAGIGLSIARKVVELHGGRIWLQSEAGVGSHIFFTLPVKPTDM